VIAPLVHVTVPVWQYCDVPLNVGATLPLTVAVVGEATDVHVLPLPVLSAHVVHVPPASVDPSKSSMMAVAVPRYQSEDVVPVLPPLVTTTAHGVAPEPAEDPFAGGVNCTTEEDGHDTLVAAFPQTVTDGVPVQVPPEEMGTFWTHCVPVAAVTPGVAAARTSGDDEPAIAVAHPGHAAGLLLAPAMATVSDASAPVPAS
jgi:hypothetical protein